MRAAASPSRSSRALASGVLALALSAGCLTIGQEFDVLRVDEIRIGATTQKELRTMLGPPYRWGNEDGARTWTYVHYKLRMIGDDHTRDLYVKFDSQGQVSSYTFNTNFPEDPVD